MFCSFTHSFHKHCPSPAVCLRLISVTCTMNKKSPPSLDLRWDKCANLFVSVTLFVVMQFL